MAVVTLLSGATANGRGTPLDCRNAKKASFVITGTFDAAVNFEFSQDGTNYYPFTGLVNGSLESSVTYSAGHVLFDVEPVAYIVPNVSAYKSGSITVTGYVDDTKVTSVQLTGSAETITVVSLAQTASVAAGSYEAVQIFAPTGYVSQVIIAGIRASAPPGATTGTHSCDFIFGGTAGRMGMSRISAQYSAVLEGNNRYSLSSGQTFTPNDLAAYAAATAGLWISPSIPLVLFYKNSTDVAQTNQRDITVYLLNRKVI